MREAQSIVDVINGQLGDRYGIDIVTGLPIFRVVWSDDQMEKRFGTFDDYIPGTQIFIRSVTETREVPKYRQWIHAKHVLERLVLVPESQQAELTAAKFSYEPLWIFQDDKENYRPPTLDSALFIIDSVLAAQAYNTMMITGRETRDKASLRKYVDPFDGKSTDELKELHKKKIDSLTEELYGDETGLMGATLSRNQGGGEAIIVPHKQFVKNEEK